MVNFLPLKIFPKISPPISEKIHIEKRKIIFNFELGSIWFIPLAIPSNTNIEKINKYNRLNNLHTAIVNLFLRFLPLKILTIKPLNSIHEIIEMIINKIINIYV